METQLFTKKNFWITTILFLLVLLLLRIFVFRTPNLTITGLTASIIENIFVSLLVSVIISYLIFYILKNEEHKKIDVIPSSARGLSLLKLRQDTSEYFFRGNVGSFARTDTIPFFLNTISQPNSPRNFILRLNLLDPTNKSSCEKYAKLKNAVDNKKRIAQNIKVDIISTVLEALKASQNNPYFKAEISFRQSPKFLRYDISSSQLLITKEDPKAAAILADNKSFLYEAIKEELIQTEEIKLSFPLKEPFRYEEHSKQNITSALSEFNMNNHFDAHDIEDILEILLKNEKRYA